MGNTTTRRAFLPVTVVLMAMLMGGCASTRDPSSPYVTPPFDFAQDRWETDLAEMRAEPERSLPRQDYLLGPGDVLSIAFMGRPDLLGETTEGVDNRARITVTESPFVVLPYIGSVRIHGKTAEQFQTDITAAYTAIVKDPAIHVTVDKYYWNQVSVLGSVKSPGRYPLEPNDTLLDGIFRAGGLTLGGKSGELPPARILKIYREPTSQRQRVTTTMEEMLQEIRTTGTIAPREEIVLPLDSFLLGGDLSFNMMLQPGDIVFVPPAGTVTVHGQVTRPRVVFLGPGIRTLAQVMTEVGYIKYQGESRIEIVRPRLDGETDSIFVNVRRIMKRKDPDIMIEDNDQIFVYTNSVRNTLASIGSIFRATAQTGVNATYNPTQ